MDRVYRDLSAADAALDAADNLMDARVLLASARACGLVQGLPPLDRSGFRLEELSSGGLCFVTTTCWPRAAFEQLLRSHRTSRIGLPDTVQPVAPETPLRRGPRIARHQARKARTDRSDRSSPVSPDDGRTR